MSKLRPMSLSSATGTNSVVLKMKAARARAMTPDQLDFRASAVASMGGLLLQSERVDSDFQAESRRRKPTSKGLARLRRLFASEKSAVGRDWNWMW